MKKLLFTLSVVAALVFAGISQQSPKLEPTPIPRHHEVVVIWAQQRGSNPGDGYQYDGAYIEVASSSLGAPHYPGYKSGQINGQYQCADLAESLAQLMDQGYVVSRGSDALEYIAIKSW